MSVRNMKTIKVLVIAGIFILFFGIMFYRSINDDNKNLNYNFKGKVESIYYDIKGIPLVTINQKSYYLSYNNWNFDHQIEKGDSLEKVAPSFIIKLKKLHTGTIIIIK